jgi:tetratricopeptide (TPR) repeat protein
MGTSTLSAAQKRFRDRASRLSRALLSEKRRSGYLSDGSGRRYRIGPLYALAGDLEKALKHYEWFERHCSDDIGEPFHYLWWALTLHRAGNLEEANERLLEAMVRNLYLLPHLVGLALPRQDMWHSSNWDEPEYISQVSEEFLPQLSDDERHWIQQQLESRLFRRAKDEYVAAHHALLGEDDIGKRRAILRRWENFWSNATN